MPCGKEGERGAGSTNATVGYGAELWRMADALRGSIDPAEYRHVVLGLIFPKYICDIQSAHGDTLGKDHFSRRCVPEQGSK